MTKSTFTAAVAAILMSTSPLAFAQSTTAPHEYHHDDSLHQQLRQRPTRPATRFSRIRCARQR